MTIMNAPNPNLSRARLVPLTGLCRNDFKDWKENEDSKATGFIQEKKLRPGKGPEFFYTSGLTMVFVFARHKLHSI